MLLETSGVPDRSSTRSNVPSAFGLNFPTSAEPPPGVAAWARKAPNTPESETTRPPTTVTLVLPDLNSVNPGANATTFIDPASASTAVAIAGPSPITSTAPRDSNATTSGAVGHLLDEQRNVLAIHKARPADQGYGRAIERRLGYLCKALAM